MRYGLKKKNPSIAITSQINLIIRQLLIRLKSPNEQFTFVSVLFRSVEIGEKSDGFQAQEEKGSKDGFGSDVLRISAFGVSDQMKQIFVIVGPKDVVVVSVNAVHEIVILEFVRVFQEEPGPFLRHRSN